MDGWETCRAAMNLAAAEFWATGSQAGFWIFAVSAVAAGLLAGVWLTRWRR